MKNVDVRAAIKANRLYHHEIAAELGISEYTLCIWLRRGLDPERRKLVMDAIERLSHG